MNDKQQRFCEEYIIDLNGTKAAIRAGYSERTAASIAEQLLRKLDIQEFISKLKAKRSKRTEVTADRVIKELAKIGFANISDYIEENNTVTKIKKLSRRKSAAVSAIEITETEFEGGVKKTVKFKLHDKISALTNLGRHLGIFEKDNAQQNKEVVVNIGARKK